MDEELLDDIVKFYLKSREFNGLAFRDTSDDAKDRVAALVEAGEVQVVSEQDYPNPHIRPWPSRRTIDQQIDSLRDVGLGTQAVCLYPTTQALIRKRVPKRFAGMPYSSAMARGRGTLELEYFILDVLEQYRNDPRFAFNFSDFGVMTAISDEAYLDVGEPEHDSIVMSHIGFAYDISEYDRDDPDSPIHRRVCAFYCDLAKLSDVHQQRWRTYQVVDSSKLSPHPVWWGAQMGHWPDGLGPFQRMFFELRTLNELNILICGAQLFKTDERPSDFGWILRPSQREWDAFVHELDKLLSENFSGRALDALGAPRKTPDDQNLGSISRFEELLKRLNAPAGNVREVVKPFRDVRKARQRPAHAIRANLTDETFVHKQIALMREVVSSLIAIRRFWASHPSAASWQEPDYISSGASYLT